MIRLKINLSKVDESAIFVGKSGARYLDVTVIEKRDDYGNDYMVTQDIGKDRRMNGERGPILGNGKKLNWSASAGRPAQTPQPTTKTYMNPTPSRTPPPQGEVGIDDVPF